MFENSRHSCHLPSGLLGSGGPKMPETGLSGGQFCYVKVLNEILDTCEIFFTFENLTEAI